MEVGRSKEFRHKLAKSLVEISLYFQTISRREQPCWIHNRSSASISDCTFLYHSLSVTSAWWPLNRGDNNGRILFGKTKKWPQPLNRGLISHTFLQLFRVFYYWSLNGHAGSLLNRWSLNGRSTVVWAWCLRWAENHVKNLLLFLELLRLLKLPANKTITIINPRSYSLDSSSQHVECHGY